jgi:hypothetical protein
MKILPMQLIRLSLTLLIVCAITSCEKIAVIMTPQNRAATLTTALSKKAQDYFWKTLHQGQYHDIPKADYLLMAAYLENPNDPSIAAHLGFLHIWKITERARNKVQNPLITNEIILARKYFKTAHLLAPHNPIYEGFLGDSYLTEGHIFQNKRLETKGYFILQHAISMWPEFNYFTAGYPMSSLPVESPYFKEAISWQWKTLDLCAEKKINRQNPNFKFAMHLERQHSKKRACWNSWIAPFNFEGFFLNMGDMVVKAGDWTTGIILYKNAKLAKNYHTWPYRFLLESRIKHAKENVKEFRKNNNTASRTILFNSGFGCVACHQAH